MPSASQPRLIKSEVPPAGASASQAKPTRITRQDQIDRALATQGRPAAIGGMVRHLTAEPGLDLLVYREGPGRWRWRGRPHGKRPDGTRWPQTSVLIGNTSSHSLAEAKTEATALRLRNGAGGDPAAERRAAAQKQRDDARAALAAAKAAAAARITCGMKLDEYERVLASRQTKRGKPLSAKHQREERLQVGLALDLVGVRDLAVGDITKATVEKIMLGTPLGSRAARFGALHRFLSWAMPEDATPPTARFRRHERPTQLLPRQRVLTAEEWRAVWMAADGLREAVHADLVRLMMLVPCRESEAAAARWRDLDLAGGRWNQPTSKNGDAHAFPLLGRALALLLERRTGTKPADLVFPAPQGEGRKLVVGWSNIKASLDRRLPKEMRGTEGAGAWTFHDLRRTAATRMVEAGADPAVVDMILNHRAASSRSRIQQTYIVADRWSDRVAAMTLWSQWIEDALDSDCERNAAPDQDDSPAQPTATVIALRGAA